MRKIRDRRENRAVYPRIEDLVESKKRKDIAQEYFEYVRDKNIILIGPAGYLQGQGRAKEFDSYDLIVRIKWGKGDGRDYGTRTDISYWPLKRRAHLEALCSSGILKDYNINWIVPTRYYKFLDAVRRITPLRIKIYFPEQKSKSKYVKRVQEEAGSHPDAGVETILHLLDTPIKSLTVVGMDFYASGYVADYEGILLKYFTSSSEKPDILKLLKDCREVRGQDEWAKGEKIDHKKLALFIGTIDDPRLILDEPIRERIEQAKKNAI